MTETSLPDEMMESALLEDDVHPHHGHTGIPWLDVILAGSAILISIISLFVSILHGRTMEKLVEANATQVRASTLPILRFWTGNFLEETHQSAVHFDIMNGGTGPAIIEWFSLSYRGHPVKDGSALLDACCRSSSGQSLGPMSQNAISGQTLAPGKSLVAYVAQKGAGDGRVYQALESSGRFAIEAHACYCSVLEECWLTDFRQTRPQRVASCDPLRPKLVW
jgi:hypothetical protein